jgi:sugar lactone lactonase YvrE
MNRSTLTAAPHRLIVWLMPILLGIGPSGCGGDGGGDHYYPVPYPVPQEPLKETGLFLIAGDLCAHCSTSADGTGSSARFNNPEGIAADQAGNLYVAERASSTIRKVTAQGVVTTLAGTTGAEGSADGTGAAARFRTPSRLEADQSGNLFVTDLGNSTIRKITPDGVVTTVAGTAGVCGTADGTGTAAQFCQPQGIAIDQSNNLYVTDTINHTVRKIDPAGVVTTLAGTAGVCGSADGLATAAQFCQPQDIAVDNLGNLYVADTANSTIRKITAAGLVTTLAGRAGECGTADGSGTAARFCLENGIAVDKAGNLFVADTGNSTIRKITAAGVVSTLAGVAGNSGNVLGPLPGGLDHPLGITVTDTNTLAVTSHNLVLKVVVPPN